VKWIRGYGYCKACAIGGVDGEGWRDNRGPRVLEVELSFSLWLNHGRVSRVVNLWQKRAIR